jgi:hypothetical protein
MGEILSVVKEIKLIYENINNCFGISPVWFIA